MEAATGKTGSCIVNRERADFIRPIATFVAGTGLFKQKELKILPDLVFNVSGISIAFIVIQLEDLQDHETLQRIRSMGNSFHKSFVIVIAPGLTQTSAGGSSAASLSGTLERAVADVGKPPLIFMTSMPLACVKVVALVQVMAENRLQGTQDLIQEEKIKQVTSAFVIHSAVSSIPGVSSRTADKMLQRVGSLKEIAAGTSTTLMQASGIKAEDAEKIHDFFLSMS